MIHTVTNQAFTTGKLFMWMDGFPGYQICFASKLDSVHNSARLTA